jgi:hypothetical protein
MRKVFLAIGLMILLAGGVWAQNGRGLQYTPDDNRALVVTDVGNEHWSINLDLNDATVSGNVERPLEDPVFLWCDPIDIDDDDIEYDCYAADSCDDDGDDCDDWDFVTTVEIPFSFFGL